MDDAAGREAGFPSAIGMGNLIWSYFHRLLRDGLGGRGRIEKIGVRYWQPNLRDSTIILRAKVIEVVGEGETARVRLELLAEDTDARRLVSGEATVVAG
jgi:hypothetical protein